MKKIIALLLALAAVFCLTACGKDAPANPVEGEDPVGTSPFGDPGTHTDPVVSPTQPGEDWDAKDIWMATDGKTMVNFYVYYPQNSGVQRGDGLMAWQDDQTVIVVGAQRLHDEPVASLDNLFPAYFSQIETAYQGYYGFLFENFVPTITSSQPVTVGDYEMYKFTGKVEFDEGEKHHSQAFVIYGTRTKGNGAYAYWAVMDTSADQSKAELIESHAYNMARLFREE